MPIYTVNVVVEVAADSRREGMGVVRMALDCAKQAEIVFIHGDVTAEREDDEETR